MSHLAAARVLPWLSTQWAPSRTMSTRDRAAGQPTQFATSLDPWVVSPKRQSFSPAILARISGASSQAVVSQHTVDARVRDAKRRPE